MDISAHRHWLHQKEKNSLRHCVLKKNKEDKGVIAMIIDLDSS